MHSYEHLEIEPNGDVVSVFLSRPPVNAVNQKMYQEIRHLFDSLHSGAIDGALRPAKVVILAGRGKNFCGGNDLAEFGSLSPANGPARMWEVREAFWAIRRCRLPVVAAVAGAALGTGLAIAASCDLVIASDDAKFGLPEIGVGVMGGARHLQRLVPTGVVRRMFFTGEPVAATQLAQYGAVADIVARAELLSAARRLADRVTVHSRLAIEVAKESLNGCEELPLEAGYRFEQGLTSWMSQHRDSKEALTALREHRKPVFDNQVPEHGVRQDLIRSGLVG